MKNKMLKRGNLKLSKGVGVWTLPATMEICGRQCPQCYAIKAQKLYPNVMSYRERKLEESKSPDWVDDMILEILTSKNLKFVRVHESGEFYSQEYVNKWYEIAKICTSTIFYAYSKRLEEFDFETLKSLPNFVLHNSLYENALNYGKNITPTATALGGVVCPLTMQKDWHGKCGDECTWCMQKCNEGTPIFFEKH
jgi:hypothetical protein